MYPSYLSQRACYQGILTYTPLTSSQPLTNSTYKYILLNTEFTENVAIQSIKINAFKEGNITLEVNLFIFSIKY